ncbi:MAG: glycosyltransferase family 4 protein [Anaerolineales bacterium]|nr:glycosyltransferase family 4 protein [Anaerolineales bacterium]
MKIVMASHHFPPRYTGGVELITQRAAHWLLDQGYEVEIVCIESVDHNNVASKLEAKLDVYEGIPVHRLYLTQSSQEDPFQNSYRNPVIGIWFEKYLEAVKPDIFHIQSCYLFSASIIDAAKKTKNTYYPFFTRLLVHLSPNNAVTS